MKRSVVRRKLCVGQASGLSRQAGGLPYAELSPANSVIVASVLPGRLDPTKLGDCLFNRPEFLNERDHRVLGIIQLLRFL